MGKDSHELTCRCFSRIRHLYKTSAKSKSAEVAKPFYKLPGSIVSTGGNPCLAGDITFYLLSFRSDFWMVGNSEWTNTSTEVPPVFIQLFRWPVCLRWRWKSLTWSSYKAILPSHAVSSLPVEILSTLIFPCGCSKTHVWQLTGMPSCEKPQEPVFLPASFLTQLPVHTAVGIFWEKVVISQYYFKICLTNQNPS